MNTISAIFVISGLVSAIIISIDLIGRPQSMKIMNAVWVLTALWATVGALILYFWFGRQKKATAATMTMAMPKIEMKKIPVWQSRVSSTLHCGAGCTLADLLGEWLIFLFTITIVGSSFLATTVIDYLLALGIGLFFQYSAIRSMGSISPSQAWRKAAKADILSLSAWQVGMYGFIAIAIFVLFPENLAKDSWTFWFMMQIAMLCGFLTALPVNYYLIRHGIKEAM